MMISKMHIAWPRYVCTHGWMNECDKIYIYIYTWMMIHLFCVIIRLCFFRKKMRSGIDNSLRAVLMMKMKIKME